MSTAQSGYRVGVRPFHRLSGRHGSLFVHTDAATVFEINGVRFLGAAGLAELATLPPLTATLALGSLAHPRHRFIATEVHAGSSVPYGMSDVVTGAVRARSGNSLTLMGVSLLRKNGVVNFRDSLTVNVSASTRVVREGATTGSVPVAEISVGSRITAFGDLNPGLQILDATGADDLVRILHSSLAGTVISVAGGTLRANLQTIDGRVASRYDFSGTGTSPATDASPTDYEIDVAGLALPTPAVGDPIRVRGFVRAFGAAPADFSARTVIDLSEVPALLAVDWTPATSTPFVSAGPTALLLELAGSPLLHHVFRAAVATDLVGPTPVVKPEAGGRGLFAVARAGSVQVFGDFSDYVTALQAELGTGRQADFTAAHGLYDDATAELTARRAITVVR